VRRVFRPIREEVCTVAEVELTEDTLSIHVRGMDRLWALRSHLEIPLSHVSGAEAAQEAARGWWQGIRSGGTHVPGVITAGTFHQEGERVFWDVHDPEKAIVIGLRDERYARLVIEVEDPPGTVAAIEEALGR
jgi:hypothetical protein